MQVCLVSVGAVKKTLQPDNHPHQNSFTFAAGYKGQGQRMYRIIINLFLCASWPML